jgi:hypothetical protein
VLYIGDDDIDIKKRWKKFNLISRQAVKKKKKKKKLTLFAEKNNVKNEKILKVLKWIKNIVI